MNASSRSRARVLAAARARGIRPPRAFWAARYAPARLAARAGKGPVAQRARETRPRDPRLPPRAPEPLRPVALFYAINGSGLGHLARALAIARHLKELTPVFVTTSSRADVLDAYGIEHRYVRPWEALHAGDPSVSRATWNAGLAEVLREELERERPALIVFDGVAADAGLVDAWRAFPHAGRAGIRRAYRLDGREHLVTLRDAELDLLLLPHEPQSERIPLPAGPSARWIGSVVSSGIDEALPRAQAREELGLPPDGVAVLLQLGSGVFGATRSFIEPLVGALSRLGVDVVVTRYRGKPPAGVHVTDRFPISPAMAAFDLAIAAAGYNTVTELMHHGIPSVLIPNDSMLSDDQTARALKAARAGAAFAVREGDVGGIIRAARRLIDDETLRAEMAERAGLLVPRNGGPEGARALDDYARKILER